MLKLEDRKWGEYQLSEVFSISSTKSSIDKNKLNDKKGFYPYVTRSEVNNGINDFIDVQEGYDHDAGNCITIGLDTQTAFYQKKPFYTGQNVQVLRSNKLNEYNANFILPLLKNLMVMLSWGGNGATLTRLKRSIIVLPISEQGCLDWNFMEQYTKERYRVLKSKYKGKALNDIPSFVAIPKLEEKEWKEFAISDVFEIKSGKRLTKNDMTKGERPFVGSSDANNGITNFVGNTNASIDQGVLGVNYNGSVVENFYHSYECVFSDDVKRFRLKNASAQSKYTYLFLKTIILQQKSKYAYGYKFNEKRMKKQQLLLPVDCNGHPDWDYMQQYSKNIIHRQMKKYLQHQRP